jgi:hypothetical protein
MVPAVRDQVVDLSMLAGQEVIVISEILQFCKLIFLKPSISPYKYIFI